MSEALELEMPEAFRAASALAGGVGLVGDGCCGAYLGGAMIISALTGRELHDLADPGKKRVMAYKLTQAFHARFTAHYGSVICRDVQHDIFGRSFNLLDRADNIAFDAAGAHTDKCPSVVANAARWTVEVLGEAGVLDLPVIP